MSQSSGHTVFDYRIAAARPKDVPLLPPIELAANTLFDGYVSEDVPSVTTSEESHEEAQSRGHLWVALNGDVPVGFALVELIEPGAAHLEELDVHPDHNRRGVGSRLVMTVCTWAASQGYRAVTLTTFRDVPFNMPFYARLGFEVVPPEELSPALRSRVEEEERRGLDPAIRVVMRRQCSRSA
jgi:GNAT superfamily N-acetyltransferase